MAEVHYTLCSDYQAANLDRALPEILLPVLAGCGGAAGKSVMIKPNLLEYRQENDPATVHPQLLLALCCFLKAQGAKAIAVIENPAVRTADAVIRSMGIMPELESLGVIVSNCTGYEKITSMPENCRYHQLEIAGEFRQYDLVIDFAKAKTHAMMTLTCGVKNLFGLVRGSERLSWHLAVGRNFDDFADMLLDLYLLTAPQVTLLDAVIGMEGNGPGSGDAVQLGFLCASSDALALDASVAQVLGVDDTPILRRGRARNLLTGFQNCGEVPPVHKIKLPEPPGKILEWGVYFPVGLRKLLRKMLVSHPVVDKKKCISCGLCAKKCPPQTLKMNKKLPKFDYAGCIRCYCCQEFCPQGAITVEQSRSLKVLSAVERFIRKLNLRRSSGKKLSLWLLLIVLFAGIGVSGYLAYHYRAKMLDAAARCAELEKGVPAENHGTAPETPSDSAAEVQEPDRQTQMRIEQLLTEKSAAVTARERAESAARSAAENAAAEAAVREFLQAVLTGVEPPDEENQTPGVSAMESLIAKLPEINQITVWQHRRAVAAAVAAILSEFEDHERALPLLQMAYALDIEHRPLSAETVQSSRLLGEICLDMEDFEAASEYFKESLETALQVFGETHAETAAGYHHCGSVSNALGKYSEALEYFRKSLEIYQALSNGESRDTAVANYAIGITLVRLNQRREAIGFLQQAADSAARILGADHPYTRQFCRDLQRVQSIGAGQ